jgi:hypothetical protein
MKTSSVVQFLSDFNSDTMYKSSNLVSGVISESDFIIAPAHLFGSGITLLVYPIDLTSL